MSPTYSREPLSKVIASRSQWPPGSKGGGWEQDLGRGCRQDAENPHAEDHDLFWPVDRSRNFYPERPQSLTLAR